MNRVNVNLVLIILAVCLLLSSHARAATLVAASCSNADVQTQVNAAKDGDTVSIPAGTCTWTGTVSWTNQNISVIGAGVSSTYINASTRAFNIGISNIAKASWRLSGFTLQGVASSNGLININASSAPTWSYGWRIDHINITYTGSIANDPLTIWGVTYGLIDDVNFSIGGGGTFILVAGYMGAEDGSSISKLLGLYNISLPLDLGTYKAVYIETCTFSNGGSGAYFAAFDSSAGGARVVFRYNTTGGNVYAHWNRTGEIDGIKYEVYNNTFTGDANNQIPIRLEAGTGVIFNNTVSTSLSIPQIWIDERRGCQDENSAPELMCDGTHNWDGDVESSGWPCLGQIGRAPGLDPPYSSSSYASSSPLYAWNNGNQTGCSTGGSCTNSVNLVPLTCSSGVDYTLFLRTTGNPHSDGSVDYVNNGTTPMPGYTPYMYPHPLSAPLAPPTNLQIAP
jgi:hypothetical protein